MPSELRLTRDELYERVWTTPFADLAKEYGVSTVSLGLACKKLGVPRPKPGFWTRLQHGRHAHRTPLERKRGPDEVVLFVYAEGEFPPYERDPATLDPRVKFEQQAANRIQVAETLDNPHRFVVWTEKCLRRAKPSKHGYLASKSVRCLDLRVSQQSLDRALRIADALTKALDSRGLAIQLAGNQATGTQVDVLGEKIGISMEEAFNRREKVLTAAQEKDKQNHPWHYRYPQWDYLPTDRLMLRMHGESWGWRGHRQRWTDGKRGTIENYLNRFIVGLIDGANLQKSRREEREGLEREWEEQRRREAEQARLRQEEQARIQRLEAQIFNWQKARLIREYVSTLWNLRTEGECSPSEDLSAWVAWAQRYADRIDPLSGRHPLQRYSQPLCQQRRRLWVDCQHCIGLAVGPAASRQTPVRQRDPPAKAGAETVSPPPFEAPTLLPPPDLSGSAKGREPGPHPRYDVPIPTPTTSTG